MEDDLIERLTEAVRRAMARDPQAKDAVLVILKHVAGSSNLTREQSSQLRKLQDEVREGDKLDGRGGSHYFLVIPALSISP